MAARNGSTVYAISPLKCKDCGGTMWTGVKLDGTPSLAVRICPDCKRSRKLAYYRIYDANRPKRDYSGSKYKEYRSYCAQCGIEFRSIHKDQNFCSYDCRDKRNSELVKARARARVSKLPEYSRVFTGYCEVCNGPIVSKQEKTVCSNQCNRILNNPHLVAVKTCKGCGKTFKRKYGLGSAVDYCSKRCSLRTQRKRERQRRGSDTHRARARRYGVEYQPVNWRKVFDRDGWRCQICGKPTPESARGTLRSNAPELDHRIPLAKGGDHTYNNVQCACRQCNGEKGANAETGQMPLLSVT